MQECPRCERCYEDAVQVCPEDSAQTRHTLPGPPLLGGRYLLEKRIGRGAMGQVYLARDQNLLTRRVAVKTVRPDVLVDGHMQEGEAVMRFEREARTAASVHHPNVIGVTDFGRSAEGVLFLVMEYVEGETLHHLLRREGTLSVSRAFSFLKQIAAGVEAAHDEGILHRDLKPANIFIMQRPKKSGTSGVHHDDGFVKVGDFGLAKIVSEAVTQVESDGGPLSRGIIGTPEYMAPEQMQADSKVDKRADVYALGVIAYHMLGGRPPFTGDLTQLITQKVINEPPPLSTLRSDIPPEVERVVMHALKKDAAARPADVGAWLEEFEEAAGESEAAHESKGESRVVILAPMGAEVYVDDERQGSVGRSGRLILHRLVPGRHVLRVARAGEMDDERVIEIRPDNAEQIIQAQLRSQQSVSNLTPSRGGSIGPQSSVPGVVACAKCGSRFASGVKFCGRCSGSIFLPVEEMRADTPLNMVGPSSGVSHPASMHCGHCGAVQAIGTKFCGRCGKNISAQSGSLPSSQSSGVQSSQGARVVCPKCQKSYPAGIKFCGQCGSGIRA